MIYFDNAATTRMSDVALEALNFASKECYGNPSSIYKYGKKSRNLLEESREIIAKCIGAKSEEIYFTSCGTESDNWAISQARSHGYEQVITSKIEHHAVLNPVEALQESGIKTFFLPVDDGCIVDIEFLKKVLGTKKTLVSVMFQNNETGVIQPIKEIASIVHKANDGSLFHTDAVQAVGHTRIDVKDLGVDMLSASAHKFNGPKGIGFLYVKDGCKISPLIKGGGQERNMRSGTENVASIYAMAKALEENTNELDYNHHKIQVIEDKLLSELKKNNIAFVLNTKDSARATGVINLSFVNVDGEGLLHMLDLHDIAVSVGSACNSNDKEPSYVLFAMGVPKEQINSAIRISIGKYNTIEDVDKLVSCIVKFYNITNHVN